MASDTIAREVRLFLHSEEKERFELSHTRQSRGVLPKLEDDSDKGELRTLTQLILDLSEVCLKFFLTFTNRQSPFTP